ncbi:AfsR/SARP family transcriptional regulator [Mangrovihabitans endophyticus]|uniref:SARP family transcriptional regulator n=1 Tax=Mangrovihabitans endophyticus TaxID=1751298 RepID=A0A8J3FTH9_9ACTN|nr:BTAD domain-containing putative transcriptional regulator [Mangrovihabitans endophyticus]GGL20116.1 SARP family transcriptional regulator [Mangrovihabitans endophyticus]
MELRVLGPVELHAGDRIWEVGPPQRRHVLAALAVDAGHPVSVETLIDRVWDDDAPPGARRALQVHLSHLRRLLERAGAGGAGTTALNRRSGGYLLQVDPDRIDLHRFRALVRGSRARPGAGIASAAPLREALALWRGTPLSGLGGAWITRMRQTWQRWHVEAAAAWADAELADGNPGEVIGPLLELTGEYPLAEPLAAALLRALHTVGRSAEALDHYAALRAHLARELGTDPGAELQAVHQAILRGETGPPAARPGAVPAVEPPTPAQLPADVPGFAGRAGPMAQLDKLLDITTGSGTVISAVSGTAGVGKTALAVHWARTVAHRFPDGQLYVNLRGFDPSGRVMDPAEAVRGFLDALGVPPHGIPPSADAQIARYRGLVAGRRMLIVLDNARDAEQVRPLLPGTPTALTLVTSRDRLTGLLATDGAHSLVLDVLAADESHDMLARRLGGERVAEESDAAARIIAACARLPLALSIAAARAQQSGFPLAALAAELGAAGQRLGALDAGDPVSDVRAVFSWSYATLTAPAARLYRLLGLNPGPDLSTAAAAALAGVPVPAARELLLRLVRANLLDEHRPGRYTQHDLLRAYAAELAAAHDPEDARDAATGRLLAYYTHSACTANWVLYPTLEPMAVPLEPAADGAGAEHPADRQAAMDWLAAEHANLLAVAGHAARTGRDARVWQLAWGLDTFHYRQSHGKDQAAAWQAAVAAADHLGNLVARAYAHRRLGEACRMLGQPADAYAHAQHALRLFADLGATYGQGTVQLDLSMLAEQQGDIPRALGHAEQALAVARAGGYQRLRARALNTVGWFHAQLGDYDAALAHCQEGLDMNLRVGDLESTAATLDSIGYAYRHRGDYDRAIESYQRSVALFGELGYTVSAAGASAALGDTHLAAGDAEAARSAWQRAWEAFVECGHDAPARDVRDKLRSLDRDVPV